jgi:hypothetical protein
MAFTTNENTGKTHGIGLHEKVKRASNSTRPNLRVAQLVKSFGPPELAESLDDVLQTFATANPEN